MAMRICERAGCGGRVREGLRRTGTGADGQPLADGRFCWRCRARQATAETRRAAEARAAEARAAREAGRRAW